MTDNTSKGVGIRGERSMSTITFPPKKKTIWSIMHAALEKAFSSQFPIILKVEMVFFCDAFLENFLNWNWRILLDKNSTNQR